MLYRSTRYPIQTFKLLRRFTRFMKLRDVIYLIAKPFLGRKTGSTKAEVISRAVEHGDLKSAAADMTQLADEALEHAITQSKVERARIQARAEAEQSALDRPVPRLVPAEDSSCDRSSRSAPSWRSPPPRRPSRSRRCRRTRTIPRSARGSSPR